MEEKINLALKISFVLLLLLIPLGEMVRIDLGNNIAVKPIDIGVLLTIVFWLFKKPKSKNFSEIYIFTGSLILSLIVNLRTLQTQEFLVALLYLARWFLYSQILFVVLSFNSSFRKKIICILGLTGGLVILLGYVQYFYYQNLKNLYYLGWDEHLYRMFSTILDPNFSGAFFVLYFIFILGFLIEHLKEKTKKKVLLLSISLVLSLVSIYLTYSRSAILMLFVSSLTLLFLRKKLKLILVLFLISAVVFVILSKNFYIENTNLLRIASSEARVDSAKKAIKIIRNNPIFGVGFNAYRYAQIRHGFREEIKTINSHADAGTDNSFLFIFATAGIIGFTAYILLWRKLVKNAYISSKKSTIRIIALSSILGLFVDSLFINSLFFPIIMLWMWILIGLTGRN